MKKILSALLLLMLVSTPVLFAEDVKTYFPNGKVQMETSGNTMRQYYENGQMMSEVHSNNNGDPTGVGKMFYQDGKLMREDDYEKKIWKQYGPDGNLMAEGKM